MINQQFYIFIDTYAENVKKKEKIRKKQGLDFHWFGPISFEGFIL